MKVSCTHAGRGEPWEETKSYVDVGFGEQVVEGELYAAAWTPRQDLLFLVGLTGFIEKELKE